MLKQLKIAKEIKGYKPYCTVCNHELGESSICGKNKGSIEKCNHKGKFIGRVVVYEPNSKKRRVLMIHETDPELIRKIIADFRYKIKSGKQEEKIETTKNQEAVKNEFTYMECLTFYVAFLEHRRGGAHAFGELTIDYKKDTIRTLVLFAKALKGKGIDPSKICISDITQEHVGIFHEYLLKEKKYSNRSYNKRMDDMKRFFNYLIVNEKIVIDNEFSTVKKRATHTQIRTVESKHFLQLLEIITPERGVQVLSTGEKKRHYHTFLKNAFILGLLTGLRREQLVSLSFKNIQENSDGLPEVIVSDNLKVNRIMGIEDCGNKRITTTPVTPQLRQLLIEELDYNNNKGSDNYLVAGDSHLKRKTIMNILSKSFTHYWQQLPDDVPKDLSFANMRKSFATKVALAFGDNARHITDHSSQNVLNRHYINKVEIARNASKQDLFPDLDLNEINRKEELEKIRIQQQKGISKER